MQAKELGRGYLAVIDPALGALFICRPHVLSPPKSHNCNVLVYLHRQRTAVGEPEGICHSEELGYGGGRGLLNKAAMQENWFVWRGVFGRHVHVPPRLFMPPSLTAYYVSGVLFWAA